MPCRSHAVNLLHLFRGEAMKMVYTILAGKLDDGEENIKFCDDAETMEDAQRIIQEKKLYQYPICRVEITGFEAA